jgi:hypothetical protein
MNDFWQRRLLIVAAGWNVLGGASALFDPPRHFTQLFTESLSLGDPLQAFFFRCTWINVIAWGAAYLLAALWQSSRMAVLLAGGAGKVAYCGACIALYSTGVGKPMLLGAGIVDLVLAALFAVALMSNRRASVPR